MASSKPLMSGNPVLVHFSMGIAVLRKKDRSACNAKFKPLSACVVAIGPLERQSRLSEKIKTNKGLNST